MSKQKLKNDVEILDFLERLREDGIKIWAEGDKIRYRVINSQLPLEVLENIKRSKKELLDFFTMVEKNEVPLTSMQLAYIVGQKPECELSDINAHYYIEFKTSELDIERLEKAINIVITKNDALRMIVTHEGKASFLENVPFYSIPVHFVNKEEDRRQKRTERSHYRYNYYKWPMFYFGVGKTIDRNDILYVDFDCIILDAWSAKLMLEEIFELYMGKDVPFPQFSFMEYMRIKTHTKNQKAEAYWKSRLKYISKIPALNFQKKFVEVQHMNFERVEYGFSIEETNSLNKKIKEFCFTPAAVLSTIFMKTLTQYSNTSEVAVNVTLFNRQPLHKEVNRVLGEFTNTAVISYREETHSILNAIRETQNQMWKVVQYRDFDGMNILRMLSRGNPGKAVMPIVFTCMVGGSMSVGEKRNYPFKEEFAISQTPQVILDHHVRDDLGYLKISWDYLEEIFDRQNIAEMFRAYIVNIKKFINNNVI